MYVHSTVSLERQKLFFTSFIIMTKSEKVTDCNISDVTERNLITYNTNIYSVPINYKNKFCIVHCAIQHVTLIKCQLNNWSKNFF